MAKNSPPPPMGYPDTFRHFPMVGKSQKMLENVGACGGPKLVFFGHFLVFESLDFSDCACYIDINDIYQVMEVIALKNKYFGPKWAH